MVKSRARSGRLGQTGQFFERSAGEHSLLALSLYYLTDTHLCNTYEVPSRIKGQHFPDHSVNHTNLFVFEPLERLRSSVSDRSSTEADDTDVFSRKSETSLLCADHACLVKPSE